MDLRASWKVVYDYLFGEHRNQARLTVCLLIVVLMFFFSRLPFFLYYPLPIAYPDTATYLWQLEKIENGVLPTFELRTPGYPLFWWLCRIFSHNILLVIYSQNGITLLSVILILLLLARYSPQFLVSATFALSVFISSPTHVAADMFLLTESVFVNSMLLFAVFLYMTLHTHKTIFALMTSLSAAAAIYIRPSAAMLVPILAIAAFILFVRWGRKIMLGLVAPISTALIVLVLYNALTIKLFKLSGGSDWAMLWSTSIYLEPDPVLPDEINKAILAKSSKISDSDKKIIYDSWNLLTFQETMERNIWDPVLPIVRIIGSPGPDSNLYLKQRRLCRQLYQTAVRQHPDVYLKNFIGAFILYFMKVGRSDWGDFYSHFPLKQYWVTFVEPSFYVKNLKDYYDAKPPSGFKVAIANGRKTLLVNLHLLTNLYCQYARIRALLFENLLWIIPLVLGATLSAFGLIGSKGSSVESLFILLMFLCLLGHAIISAVTGHIEKRYTYTLEFVNYLAFALTPFALRLKKAD